MTETDSRDEVSQVVKSTQSKALRLQLVTNHEPTSNVTTTTGFTVTASPRETTVITQTLNHHTTLVLTPSP